jgi:hypothetical protein
MPKIASARHDADSPSNARKSDGLSASARLEALDGAVASGAGALIPEMPPLPHQRVGPRHHQRVAALRAADNPAAILAQMLPHLGDRDVDGVARDVRALPRLRHHHVAIDERPGMVGQHPQRMEGARPQRHFDAVARQR